MLKQLKLVQNVNDSLKEKVSHPRNVLFSFNLTDCGTFRSNCWKRKSKHSLPALVLNRLDDQNQVQLNQNQVQMLIFKRPRSLIG